MEHLPIYLSAFAILLIIALTPVWVGSLARLAFGNVNKKTVAAIIGFFLLAGYLFLMRAQLHDAYISIRTGLHEGMDGWENADQIATWGASFFFVTMVVFKYVIFYWMVTGGILLVDKFRKKPLQPEECQ